MSTSEYQTINTFDQYLNVNNTNLEEYSLKSDSKLMEEIELIHEAKYTLEEKNIRISELIDGKSKTLDKAENESDFSALSNTLDVDLLKFCNKYIGYKEKILFDWSLDALKSNIFTYLNLFKSYSIDKIYISEDLKTLNEGFLNTINKEKNNLDKIKTALDKIETEIKRLETEREDITNKAKNVKITNPLKKRLVNMFGDINGNLIFNMCNRNEVLLEDTSIFLYNETKEVDQKINNILYLAIIKPNYQLAKYIMCKFGVYLNLKSIKTAIKEYEKKNDVNLREYFIKPDKNMKKQIPHVFVFHSMSKILELCDYLMEQKTNIHRYYKSYIEPN